MFAAFLVILFVGFILLGVPIAFSLGFVSFVGIASLPTIPNIVVFQKMFNGLNSFTLLAVPLCVMCLYPLILSRFSACNQNRTVL